MILHCHATQLQSKENIKDCRRQFLIDENSEGEMMSEEMAKKKKYRARIYRVNDPSIV